MCIGPWERHSLVRVPHQTGHSVIDPDSGHLPPSTQVFHSSLILAPQANVPPLCYCTVVPILQDFQRKTPQPQLQKFFSLPIVTSHLYVPVSIAHQATNW